MSQNARGVHAGFSGRALQLLAMLVGSGEKLRRLAAQSVEAGLGVARYRRVGMTEVRLVVT